MDKKKSASVFGASGLVGTSLVETLAKDTRYNFILVANQSHKEYQSENITEVIVDFQFLGNYTELFEVDEVFVSLGTTIKKAGSKEKFEEVDLELPIKIAHLAKVANVSKFIMITALGANASSSNFYIKTKGKVEQEILKLELKNACFVQPSLLMGDRKESRTAERIAIWWMKRLDFLFFGPLRKYKGIYDYEVASAMIQLANSKIEKHIYQSDELKDLSAVYRKKHEYT